jgi:hypothetical protein
MHPTLPNGRAIWQGGQVACYPSGSPLLPKKPLDPSARRFLTALPLEMNKIQTEATSTRFSFVPSIPHEFDVNLAKIGKISLTHQSDRS